MPKKFLCALLALALSLAMAGAALAEDTQIIEMPSVITPLEAGGAAPDAPAQEEDLAALFEAFRAEHSLTEDNFAVSYYDTVTGESYDWNETQMLVAASTYKLPLNLYYYELENAGEITPDTMITEGGATLDRCHYLSIVESNNEISHALLYRIGTFPVYKEAMRKYFTMTDEEIDPKYYRNNFYCTRMMMDTLKYVYERAEEFPELLEYMKQSHPQNDYFKKYVTDVEIAHKYGSFEGAENDVGIFYTERPFLLAVYTQSAGVEIVSQAAKLAYDYNIEQTELAKRAAREEELAQALASFEEEKQARMERAAALAERVQQEKQALREQEQAFAREEALKAAQEAAAQEAARAAQTAQETAAEEAPSPFTFQRENFEWWMLAVAAGVALLGGGSGLLIWRASRVKLSPEEEEEPAQQAPAQPGAEEAAEETAEETARLAR